MEKKSMKSEGIQIGIVLVLIMALMAIFLLMPFYLFDQFQKEETAPKAIEAFGHVLYGNNSPASGITMNVEVDGQRFSSAITDQDGTYKFVFPSSLRPSDYTEISGAEYDYSQYRKNDIWENAPMAPTKIGRVTSVHTEHEAVVRAETKYFSPSINIIIDHGVELRNMVLSEKPVEFEIVSNKMGTGDDNYSAAKVLLYPNGNNLSYAGVSIEYNDSVIFNKIVPGNCSSGWMIDLGRFGSHSFIADNNIDGSTSVCTLFEIETSPLANEKNASISILNARAARNRPSVRNTISENILATVVKEKTLEINFTSNYPKRDSLPENLPLPMTLSGEIPVEAGDILNAKVFLSSDTNTSKGIQVNIGYSKDLLKLNKVKPGNCMGLINMFKNKTFIAVMLINLGSPCVLFEAEMEALAQGKAEVNISDSIIVKKDQLDLEIEALVQGKAEVNISDLRAINRNLTQLDKRLSVKLEMTS